MPVLLWILGGAAAAGAAAWLYVDSLGLPPSDPGTVITGTGYNAGQPYTVTLVAIDDRGHYLTPLAAAAFAAMQAAAEADGVTLSVTTAFRTQAQQESLLARLGSYDSGGDANQPGYSPHQRGIAVDLDVGQRVRGLPGTNDAWTWLQDHYHEFGFVNDYDVKGGAGGGGEAWHYQTAVG